MSVIKLVAKYVSVSMLAGGALLILGVIGSIDNDTIVLIDAIKLLAVGVSVFVGGFFTLVYVDKEVQNER